MAVSGANFEFARVQKKKIRVTPQFQDTVRTQNLLVQPVVVTPVRSLRVFASKCAKLNSHVGRMRRLLVFKFLCSLFNGAAYLKQTLRVPNNNQKGFLFFFVLVVYCEKYSQPALFWSAKVIVTRRRLSNNTNSVFSNYINIFSFNSKSHYH